LLLLEVEPRLLGRPSYSLVTAATTTFSIG